MSSIAETYAQLSQLIFEKAKKNASSIWRLYGKYAPKIYPSYHHVIVEIAYFIERECDIPEEVVEAILDEGEISYKLGRAALFGEKIDELED